MTTTPATIPFVRSPLNADEHALAERFARGDDRALDDVIKRYATRVTRLVQRLLHRSDDIDDIVQDVFVAVIASRRQFRRKASLSTWVTRITINRCRSLERRRALREKMRRAIWLNRTSCESNVHVEQLAIADERDEQVRDAVESLPGTLREVIVLRYFEEFSIAEMANVLSISRANVDVRLTRARRRLQQTLAEYMTL